VALTDIEFMNLGSSADHRGDSYSVTPTELASLESVQDVHIAEIRPGHIRGNHYHLSHGELITVIHQGAVSVHWDTGEDTQRKSRTFTGAGAFSFAPPLGWAHAVRNDGDGSVWIFVASDKPYNESDVDEVARDSIRRAVAE
jgi:dTDP-4-dehydrorhamnose 3,5-epimerase-like enzyme